MVKVLVGKRTKGQYSGHWAEFPAEEINSYDDKGIVYTLYRSTSVNFDGYRVHVSDETNPKAPVYELRPYSDDRYVQGGLRDYGRLYTKREIAEHYPLFAKDLDYFQTYPIDPG